jgi:hypothetical protein
MPKDKKLILSMPKDKMLELLLIYAQRQEAYLVYAQRQEALTLRGMKTFLICAQNQAPSVSKRNTWPSRQVGDTIVAVDGASVAKAKLAELAVRPPPPS